MNEDEIVEQIIELCKAYGFIQSDLNADGRVNLKNLRAEFKDLVKELVTKARQEGFEEGEQSAKDNVGDWIDMSDFAPDHSWRD